MQEEYTPEQLIQSAKEAMEHAYSPYSRFSVGAALLSSDGKVYTGCNIENASYGATCCAERVALYKAVSEGAHSFKALAIISDSGDYTVPCGICRQALSEFAPDLLVYAANNSGGYIRVTLPEMLTHAFNKSNMNGHLDG